MIAMMEGARCALLIIQGVLNCSTDCVKFQPHAKNYLMQKILGLISSQIFSSSIVKDRLVLLVTNITENYSINVVTRKL